MTRLWVVNMTRLLTRIIRNEAEWARIREYILQNPARWDEDNLRLDGS